MPITLTIGNQNLAINNAGDLLSANAAPTLLSIADQVLSGNLAQTVSAVAAGNPPSAQIKFDGGNNSWTVGDFTFGLTGSVSGTVSLLQGGQPLMQYTSAFPTTIGDGLDTVTNAEATGKIMVPAGQFYVQVALDMTLGVSAGAKVQLGSVGISGSFGNNDTFQVIFSKQVAGGVTVHDALIAAFEGFVLPLHSATYQRLQPGDYLYHTFNATLNLGFGATYGLDKVFFSGQYKADTTTPGAPGVDTSAKLEVKAGASFNATFKYSGSFEAMLWKTDNTTGRLHLYKSKITDLNFTAGLTVAVIADPTVTVNKPNLNQLATDVLPNGTGTIVSQLLNGKAQDQVNTWTTDVQNKITSWLKPLQQGSTALQVAIDNSSSSYLLTDYTFDLTAAGFTQAWSDALAGDFVAALGVANGGASLDVGSGLEQFHMRKTSVTFNLFGAFKAEWSNALIDNYSIEYAGNDTFHLVEDIGRESISKVNQGGVTIDLYFAAAATTGPAGIKFDPVDLHFVVKATQNSKGASSIAALISNATTGTASSSLTKQILAIAPQKNSVVSLEIIFKPTAYMLLMFAGLGNPIVNEVNDENNFNRFARACMLLNQSPPANFKTPQAMDYPSWKTWNIAVTNRFPPQDGDVPDRREQGPESAAVPFLSVQYPGTPATLINGVFQKASAFMNLCEDLKKLATLLDGDITWDELIKDLKAIIKKDLSIDFLPPTMLALIDAVQQPGVQPQIAGPSGPGLEPAIAVTLQYS